MDNKNIENRNNTQWYGKKIVKCIRKAINRTKTSIGYLYSYQYFVSSLKLFN